VEILSAFAQKCHKLTKGAELAQDQADLREDRYDLSALNRDTLNLHDDQPERAG